MNDPVPKRPRRPRNQKMALVIAQEIVTEISSRSLPPGTMLPSEKEMLVTYEVGRGTMREALRFLEMQGGGGPVVNNPDSRDLAQSLSLFLQLLKTPFRSIVEARQVLEPAMAASAAERIEPDHLDEIRESVERMEANLDNEEAFLRENERFHELIAWSSGNQLFGLLISSLHWITDGTALGVSYPAARQQAVLKAHRAIYEAIATREPDVAREAMSRHVTEFAKYLEQYYPAVWDSPLRWDQIIA
jgi:GntR family transcriptional repressor for pyruvate dehydrogenase complex